MTTGNLLEETKANMRQAGLSSVDVVFIGSLTSGHSCTWEEFEVLADVDYDCDFGCQEVATDLAIVFADGARMVRGEYDGSEWWDVYLPSVTLPDDRKPIRSLLAAIGWSSLADIDDRIDSMDLSNVEGTDE